MPNKDPIRRGRHVVSDCQAHLVFVTKYRRGALTKPVLEDCETIMANVCDDLDATLIEFNGEEDHVHLLVAFPPKLALSNLVNSLKGVSSRLLRQTHQQHISKHLWGNSLWSRSYYAATTGGANLETVKQYIQNQNAPTQ